MLRTPDADTALDYHRTLVFAIELSNKSWVLAAQVPGLPSSLLILSQKGSFLRRVS